MELFYNPERMSETEIKETFVAYQWLVDEIISIIKRQPKGAGVQHVVIVAPRGMGKTTLLLMLRFTVLNQEIAKRWQPVLFPEESYSVYDLADLWVEVLDHVASETSDVPLREEVQKLKEAHPNSSSLEAVALARIKDWRNKNKKRLLLLVDNFDMILEQIGDEKDNASLRDVLMNDGTMMLVGGSTTFFKEARAYDQPLYNLFKIYNLNGLDSDQTEELLRRRAKLDGLKNFEEILCANRTRLRVLEYFTGGNPRLVLMLYRVLTHSDIAEVRRGLEKLLDEVTPYYKAKIEALPPQPRKILDQIARISAQTREGLTPTEIANATRLAVNQVSSQLKRLADVGYVRAANIRGRSSYYTLSEPLYAIWHQMRFGRDVRTRMNWLVEFLKRWYDAKELDIECERLQSIFRSNLTAGQEKDARDALEHSRYLMEAIEDQQSRLRTFESIVLSYLDLSDVDTLKSEVLPGTDINQLSEETQQRLIRAGLIVTAPLTMSRDEFITVLQLSVDTFINGHHVEAAKILAPLEKQIPANWSALFYLKALRAFFEQNMEETLHNLDRFLQEWPNVEIAWRFKGFALMEESRLEDAVEAFRSAIKIDEVFDNLYWLAYALEDLERHEEALKTFEKALELQSDSIVALLGRTRCLAELSRKQEALSSIDRALSLQPDSAACWYERGVTLTINGDAEGAQQSFDKAIALTSEAYDFLIGKAVAMSHLDNTEESLNSVNRVIELYPESSDAHFLRGALLFEINIDDAVKNLNRAFDSQSTAHRFLVNTPGARALKAIVSVITHEFDQVRTDWKALVQYAADSGEQATFHNHASTVVTFAAKSGHWDLARELIISSNLEEVLFPLVRSLNYLLTQDEALLEKLSPEVRSIVDEIVATFKNSPADFAREKFKVEIFAGWRKSRTRNTRLHS